MQRKWIIVAAALAAWPAGLTAQGTPRPPRARAFMLSDHHGRIGVVVKTDASPETDKTGAKIEGVTPGGPADKAGLKVGDVITKFNGTSLAAVKAEDEDESGPGRKLVELARKLAPDDTVQVEYRRGNDTKQATLVAADLGPRFQMEMPGPPGIAMGPMLGMDHFEMFGSPWGDLELVSLNSDGRNHVAALQRQTRVLRHQGRRARREGPGGLESAAEGRRRDYVHRRAEAREPLARDADPPLVRKGRNGVDRDPAQAEAHDRGLEGSGARGALPANASAARRARGSEPPAPPPTPAPPADAPATGLTGSRSAGMTTGAADDAAPVVL